MARTFAGLAAYIATSDDSGVQIHQYAASSIRVGDVALEIDTDYPASGRIAVTITESPAEPWTLTLRIPHWAIEATLDGAPVSPGLAHLRRRFTPGETVVLDLAVRPRLTAPDPRIDSVRGTAVIERGPVVYCAESVDLPPGVTVDALRLDARADIGDVAGGVGVTCRIVATRDAPWPYGAESPDVIAHDGVPVTLRPYHDWASRGPSTMRVWLPLA